MKLIILFLLILSNFSVFALPTNFSVRSRGVEIFGAGILVKKVYSRKMPGIAISCKNKLNSRLDVCQLSTITDLDGYAQLDLDRHPEFYKFIIEIYFVGMHTRTLVVDQYKRKKIYKVFLFEDPRALERSQRQLRYDLQREKEVMAMLEGKPYPKHVKIYNSLMVEIKRVGGEENFLNKIDNDVQYANRISREYASIIDFIVRKYYPTFID